MRKTLLIVMLVILGLLSLVAALVVGARAYLHKKAFSQMTPQQIELYKEWTTVKRSYPDSAIECVPFLPATVDAAVAFRKEWDTLNDAAKDPSHRFRTLLREGRPSPDSEEMKAIFDALPAIETLLAAFKDLAWQPDYEIDALNADLDPLDFPTGVAMPQFLAVQTLARLWRIKSLQASLAGDHAAAFEAAETIIRASRANDYSFLITHLISVALVHMGTQAWYDAIQRCDDVDLLRTTLKQMNRFAAEWTFDMDSISVMELDQLGTLRSVARWGIEVNIKDVTGQELSAESFRAQAEYLEQLVLPRLNDQGLIEQTRKMVSGYRHTSAMLGGEAVSPTTALVKLASNITLPGFFAITCPNFLEARTRVKVSRVMLDLLRLSTAAKIYRLTNNTGPGSIDELVPSLLPERPVDAFTPGKAPLRVEPDFYSVGPDMQDQKAGLRYDPTNGTITPGDVFLQREL